MDEDVVLAVKPAEMLRTIEMMLNSGKWVLVMGDIECMHVLEFRVYPPGTEENRDFILTMMPSRAVPLSIPIPIALAKKTDRLRELLKMPEEEFKTILAIMLKLQLKSSDSPSKCGYSALTYRKGMRKKVVEELITTLKEKVILV